ncbi:EmrB/QacA subfamily drug resistance transporter [Streptosporangium becharense]|uniref:EmrB/QacA subfamily drug resistance transporter n=1 Tax=Streptosporangium becharense TaxID=1816182 RepID=A0A7W9IK50_9ACTN|nr:MFS transporter [Streptosporangium becharense]MBB2913108.1 EmrB/QacA subfamily drug resistance transporter [Streptosporangium becharense]MBB5822091.1 EmrB/QacA subfamily drug resistance transporter [Streptosporangium becharense]
MTGTTVAEPGTVEHAGRLRLTLFALSMAGMVVSVQQTVVIPLLPRMTTAFGVSVAEVTWVFTASLLAAAVATPLLSRLGDMYGKKRMILFTVGLLVLGSVVCALSDSLGVLIAGRALQGASAALIPLAIGMIKDSFPPNRVMTAIGVVSATMGVGGSAGMIVTGVIADRTTSHQPVFWITAGLAAVAIVLIALSTHDTGTGSGGRPDFTGAALLSAWLVCLLLAVSKGNDWGWGSPLVVGLFAGAVALCGVWVLSQVRAREPMVRLQLLVGRHSLQANLAALLLGFAMFGSFTLISGFIQTPPTAGYGFGGSVLDVGLYGLPSTVTMLLSSSAAGRLSGRLGPAYSLALGAGLCAAGFGWFTLFNGSVLHLVASNAVQGLGFGVAYAALGALAVQHVPAGQSGIASGVNSLVRSIGGSVSGAVTSAVLASVTVAGTSLPSRSAYVISFGLITVSAVGSAAVALAAGMMAREVS